MTRTMTNYLLIPVLFALLSLAWAQEAPGRWTVQTAAFSDYRQARAQVDELRELGFDAYSEFAMNGGRQYARVRVGCFTTRETAAQFADDLRGFVTAEAVPQPLAPSASPSACVAWEVGFVKPLRWEIERRGEDVVFRVELDGVVGYVRHDGEGWRLSQELPPAAAMASPVAAGDEAGAAAGIEFEQARVLRLERVIASLPGDSRLVACAGTLLWQGGNAAIVERSDSVIACMVDDDVVGGSL